MVNLTKEDLQSLGQLLGEIISDEIKPLNESVGSLNKVIGAFRKDIEVLNNRVSALENRVSALEEKFVQQDRLLMILVSEGVREQIKKDDLYPFATNEQKVETAVCRILERQNGLGDMILKCLAKQ